MPNKDDLLPPPLPPPLLDLNVIGVNLSANTERLFSEGWMDLLQFSNACVECCEGRCIDTKLKTGGGREQQLGERVHNLLWPVEHNTTYLTCKVTKDQQIRMEFSSVSSKVQQNHSMQHSWNWLPRFLWGILKVIDTTTVICYYLPLSLRHFK